MYCTLVACTTASVIPTTPSEWFDLVSRDGATRLLPDLHVLLLFSSSRRISSPVVVCCFRTKA